MSAWRHETLVPDGFSAVWQPRFPLAAGTPGASTVCKQGVLFPYAVCYTGSQRGLAVAINSPEVGQEKTPSGSQNPRGDPGGVFFVLITGGSVVSGIFWNGSVCDSLGGLSGDR